MCKEVVEKNRHCHGIVGSSFWCAYRKVDGTWKFGFGTAGFFEEGAFKEYGELFAIIRDDATWQRKRKLVYVTT